ncbi:MAG: hypothetical protein M5U09_26550 [Gammaproteobacteria bacterium]|nr:hypothetical protein [Gammaproteobacteria bacterium]
MAPLPYLLLASAAIYFVARLLFDPRRGLLLPRLATARARREADRVGQRLGQLQQFEALMDLPAEQLPELSPHCLAATNDPAAAIRPDCTAFWDRLQDEPAGVAEPGSGGGWQTNWPSEGGFAGHRSRRHGPRGDAEQAVRLAEAGGPSEAAYRGWASAEPPSAGRLAAPPAAATGRCGRRSRTGGTPARTVAGRNSPR